MIISIISMALAIIFISMVSTLGLLVQGDILNIVYIPSPLSLFAQWRRLAIIIFERYNCVKTYVSISTMHYTSTPPIHSSPPLPKPPLRCHKSLLVLWQSFVPIKFFSCRSRCLTSIYTMSLSIRPPIIIEHQHPVAQHQHSRCGVVPLQLTQFTAPHLLSGVKLLVTSTVGQSIHFWCDTCGRWELWLLGCCLWDEFWKLW